MAEVYVVASGKGGVGKSTFVNGVSAALAELGRKVLAIDCDIGLRSLDIMMGCSDSVVFDWGDIILGRCSAEDAVIKGQCDLLASPRNMDDNFTGEALRGVIDALSGDYDCIFLDAPAGIGSGFLIACGAADKAISVTTPDSVCVRSCARACDEIEKAGIKDNALVINMFEAKPVSKNKLLNIDDCIDETCVRLLGVVPLDRDLAFSSVTGEEPGEFSPSNQAFYRIAKRMTGEKVELVCE